MALPSPRRSRKRPPGDRARDRWPQCIQATADLTRLAHGTARGGDLAVLQLEALTGSCMTHESRRSTLAMHVGGDHPCMWMKPGRYPRRVEARHCVIW